jgi:poly(3-hydroxybutyrate) depolymerase
VEERRCVSAFWRDVLLPRKRLHEKAGTADTKWEEVMHLRYLLLGTIGVLFCESAIALGADIVGATCSAIALHCPDSDCPAALITHPGNATESKTGRQYFLEYPCDLKPHEQVTFVLSLHGGGPTANWMRHYFPIMDFKEKYRLVIATPSGSDFGWNPGKDDEYLHNIVEEVYSKFGEKNIKAFWLAGHSLGGQTANRLLSTDFYRHRLTGWVSFSGGRLGSKREDVRAPFPSLPGEPPAAPRSLVADASILPDYPFSFIYETGEHELTSAGLPGTSIWANKLGCGPQTRKVDIVDSKGGYVYDTRVQPNPNPVWGLSPRPGVGRVYLYPNCQDGRVVADIVRGDKGHTEGLEPRITEEIVKLMVSAH